MKKIIIIGAVIFMVASVFAQAPQKMSYQAVIRDGANALVANQTAGMQVSIFPVNTKLHFVFFNC